MVKFLFSVLLTALGATVIAQDITGIWRGTFYNEMEYMLTGARYRYEVQLKNSGKGVKGVTYSYQTTRFYGKATMVGIWSSGSGDLTFKEEKMLDLKMSDGGEGCLMTCYLSYRREGSREFLEGTYTSVNMNNDTMSCGGGRVRLEKVPDSDFEKEDFLLKSTPDSKGVTKPGQSEFLITKPAATAGKPAAPKPAQKTPVPAKPPVAKAKPAVPAPKKPAAPPASVKSSVPAPKPAPPAAVAKNTPPAPAKKPPVATAPKQSAPTPKPATIAKATVPAAKPAPPVIPADPVKKAEYEIASSAKPVPPPAPTVLKNRTNEIVETISTGANFLEISFYDNGEIDGDTISVYDNNRLLVSSKGLSTEPITIRINIDDKDPVHEVVMVAENLGTIPPNTSLMIIQAGMQRYTVRLSSTEQKNSAVKFKFDPQAPK